MIEIDSKTLKDALSNHVAKDSTAVATSMALCEFSDNQLRISTYDYTQQVKTIAEADGEPDKFTVPFEALKGAANNFSERVTLSHEKNKVIVKQGKRKQTIETSSTDIIPAIKTDDEGIKTLNTPVNQLREAIECVSGAAAKKDVRYYLNGILINQDHVAATNGHILGYVNIPQTDVSDVIIPNNVIKNLITVLNDEAATVSITDRHIFARNNKMELIAQRIAGKFPDLSRLLNSEKNAALIVNSENLRKTVSAVRALGSDGKFEKGASFDYEDGYLRINIYSDEKSGRSSEDFVPAETEGNWEPAGFNPQYIEIALKKMTGQVEIQQQSNDQGHIIKSLEDEKFRFVLMPMRL